MVAIDIQKISKWYGSFQVLKNCSTKVDKGEVVVVCGPSGSGKSTLIKTVNALEPFQSGTISVEGVSVGEASTNLSMLRARIGMVFQSFELFPHLSIEKNLALAQMIVLKRSEDDAMARGLKLLDRVGMLAHKAKFPGQLSGGQQQRAFLARALAQEAHVLLLDEPFTGLDAPACQSLGRLLDSLAAEGRRRCAAGSLLRPSSGHHTGWQAVSVRCRCLCTLRHRWQFCCTYHRRPVPDPVLSGREQCSSDGWPRENGLHLH